MWFHLSLSGSSNFFAFSWENITLSSWNVCYSSRCQLCQIRDLMIWKGDSPQKYIDKKFFFLLSLSFYLPFSFHFYIITRNSFYKGTVNLFLFGKKKKNGKILMQYVKHNYFHWVTVHMYDSLVWSDTAQWYNDEWYGI